MDYYFLAILLGVLAGFLTGKTATARQRDKLAGLVGTVSLLWLLPMHVATAGIRAVMLDSFYLLQWSMAAGVVTCLATLLSLHVVLKLAGSGEPFLKYQGATFAGGGRALAVAAIVAPFFASRVPGMEGRPDEATFLLIDGFVLFDVGYWTLFCWIIYPRMHKTFGKDAKSDRRKYTDLKYYGVLVAAIFSLCAMIVPAEWLDSPELAIYLPKIRWFLSATLVFLATMYMALKFEKKFLRGVLPGIVWIMLGRTVGFSLVIGAIWYFQGHIHAVLALPLILFFVAPPSSFIPVMLGDAGAPEEQVKRAIMIGAVWTSVFLLAGIAAMIYSFVTSFA